MAAFLEKKIRTLFVRFDMDGNGAIEEDDFDSWSEKLVSLGFFFNSLVYLILSLLFNIKI